MNSLYQSLAYQPVLNVLVYIYNHTFDLGLAIIILTIVIKLILWPLSQKAIRSQKEIQDIQPLLDKLKQEFKDDKMGLSKATMDLYREHKINPFSSCLPMLIQLPFLFAVFKVLRVGLTQDLGLVYQFLYKPEFINSISIGFIDLGKPNLYLAVLAGAAQFIQAKMMLSKNKKANIGQEVKDESMSVIMNKQMTYIFPVITVIFGASMPGGLTLYWFMFTALTILQQFLVIKKNKTGHQIIEAEIIK